MKNKSNAIAMGVALALSTGTAFAKEGMFTPEQLPLIKEELKNGELNGDYVSFYPNGKKKIEGKFRKGKQQGLWRYYSAENKILERKRF